MLFQFELDSDEVTTANTVAEIAMYYFRPENIPFFIVLVDGEQWECEWNEGIWTAKPRYNVA